MNLIARSSLILLLSFAYSMLSFADNRTSDVKIAYTTDVHGNFFPIDYTTMQPGEGSLSRIATAIDSLREESGPDNFLLLDNGDILQGQPAVYYYNYIDTVSPHLVSDIYNYLRYDATTIGNHDVETGHPVYDRWRAQNHMPMLGANVIDTASGKPYLQPYAVFNRGGLKIAVLGLITPAIPAWLPQILWKGLRFDDMTETARKWIPVIQQQEHPDIIIGLFHSGHDESKATVGFIENASLKVAREVPGFDAVLMGHDHQRYLRTITNCQGSPVHVLNPANNARALGVLDIKATFDSQGKVTDINITPALIDVRALTPSAAFLERFSAQQDSVARFVGRRIGEVSETMCTRDAFFGPSTFMSLLHKLQLEISGADISFAAPLSFDSTIKEGPIHINDMFTLYKYENMLYVLDMTGEEIRNYLEMAYDLWTNRISDSQHHLIRFASSTPTPRDNRLENPSYNFDSAAGIIYTVDITKPRGSKINIISLDDGTEFHTDRHYSVAINSYRANGGGNLLTEGAGIPAEELGKRVLRTTDKDLRYYLIKAIEKNPNIQVALLDNWRFIPEVAAQEAIRTDREILFSPESSKEQK